MLRPCPTDALSWELERYIEKNYKRCPARRLFKGFRFRMTIRSLIVIPAYNEVASVANVVKSCAKVAMLLSMTAP